MRLSSILQTIHADAYASQPFSHNPKVTDHPRHASWKSALGRREAREPGEYSEKTGLITTKEKYTELRDAISSLGYNLWPASEIHQSLASSKRVSVTMH
ncbi:hypothetical protein PZA11_002314 [Diplocarpon coronariae]